MKRKLIIVLFLLGLSACSSAGRNGTDESNKDVYRVPAFSESVFSPEKAGGENGVAIDLSSADKGIVGISAQSGSRLKFQVIREETYNYDIANDGTPSLFPLQMGNGEYRFKVFENIGENRYALLYECASEVELIDEFQPYLRPSAYVNYDRDSRCVELAAGFAADAQTALDVVNKVYDYVCGNIVYDSEKAVRLDSTYLPDPDETLSSGKGICFDYAALTAAMLRSQGIPTKVIFGYVSPEDLYHAWNMFYTEEAGWVTVAFRVAEADWNRIDLTFSANGADLSFVKENSNYTDVYVY